MRRATSLVVACLLLSSAAFAGPKKKVSKADACRQRFAALCAVVQRCSTGADDVGGADCPGIDPGCGGLSGDAPYDAEALAACVTGLKQLTCQQKADPNDEAAMDFEAKVAACRVLLAADGKAPKADGRVTASR